MLANIFLHFFDFLLFYSFPPSSYSIYVVIFYCSNRSFFSYLFVETFLLILLCFFLLSVSFIVWLYSPNIFLLFIFFCVSVLFLSIFVVFTFWCIYFFSFLSYYFLLNFVTGISFYCWIYRPMAAVNVLKIPTVAVVKV